MVKIIFKAQDIIKYLGAQPIEYKKYVTQILNLANQNAQGTRPKIVGQMSELINTLESDSLKIWEKAYKDKKPEAIDKATERVWKMVIALKEAIDKINEKTVKQWVEELIIIKTYAGLKFQKAILRSISERYNIKYAEASADDEKKGIDGYLNDKPISIKPTTYKVKKNLQEEIDAYLIYYTKTKTGISIELDEANFKQYLGI